MSAEAKREDQSTPSEELFSSSLLVEDEVNLAATLKIGLKRLGMKPRHASTLLDAEKLADENPPEFILLDRNLPDGDGIELLSSLRARGYTGAIIMLTARGQPADRIAGLNQGADDYIAKPFAWDELEARIRALSRRKAAFAAPQKRWLVEESRLRILGPFGWKELTPLEFKLAQRLMQANGEIVSRDDLLKDVWGFTLLPKTRTVDHFLGRLRKHFETDPEQPRHFLTVRGAGYRFQG